ncbi:aldo/keto reductase [Catenuloplanes niger JCM 9533]
MFVDAGGTFVDTSDSYSYWAPGHTGGESEHIIGSWLARGDRDRIVLGSKVGDRPGLRGLAADTVAAAIDGSLQRLRTDHIDLYWAHFDDPGTPLEDTAVAFDGLVRAGKVRQIGLSNYTGERIRAWVEFARREGLAVPVALQPLYNLVSREPYERDVAPVAADLGLAVYPYQAPASGLLTGKYASAADLEGGGQRRYMAREFLNDNDRALATVRVVREIARERGTVAATVAMSWLRGRPGVAAPIASARTVAQLPPMLASATFELTVEERDRLDRPAPD